MSSPPAQSVEKYNKLELKFTKKLLIYDETAGKYYQKYDDFVILFVKNVMDVFKYIQLSYPYPFTGAHNFSWQTPTQFKSQLEPKFKPLYPATYYNNLELYKTFVQPYSFPEDKKLSLSITGVDYSMIEVVNNLGPHKFKAIQFIHMPTDTEVSKFNTLKDRINSIYKTAQVSLLGKNVYTILENVFEPVDLYIYNNYQHVPGIQMAFAHTNTINALVGIIAGLKYTKPGGIFIIHFNSLINKNYANLYLFCKQWFDKSQLYMPECVNEYKQTGIYGVFIGFKGIPVHVLDELDALIFSLKKVYKNGDLDTNIYDPAIRKLCIIYKFFAENEKTPYIALNLSSSNPDNNQYRELIEFNNMAYARKLAFCKKVYNYWKNVPYPGMFITAEQYKASHAYMKKWNISYKLSSPAAGTFISMQKLVRQAQHNPATPVYTYKVASQFMDMAMVAKEFEARGNWIPYEESRSGMPLDFFFSDSYAVDNKELWGYESGLKNLIGDSKKMITNKLNLYNNLKDIPGTARFLPKTIPFDITGKTIDYLTEFQHLFKPGLPYICKVVDMGAGQGIICTDNFQEFRAFMSKYFNILKHNPAAKVSQWVLQEYITNPWLLNGKKFHIRQLFFYQPGSKPSYFMYHSRVASAELPYKKGDWTNKDIHDTHFHKYHGTDWPFAMNFSQAQWTKLKDQLEFIYACLISVLKGNCYSESKNCFEVLGVDLMLTDKMDFKLIEVNDKIGMSGTPEYNRKVFRGILTCVVDKYYEPKYTQLIPGDFIQIKWLNLNSRGKFHTNESKYVDTYAEFKTKKTLDSKLSASSRRKLFKKTSSQKTKRKVYTYLVRTDYFKDDYIDSAFTARGNWKKVYDNQLAEYKHKPIDFIYIDGLNYTNPKYYGLQSMLKNVVNDEKQSISLKHNLISAFAKNPASAKYIMPTFEVDMLDYSTGKDSIYYIGQKRQYQPLYSFFKKGKIYIFKPVSGMAGQGIRVVSSFQDLEKYMIEIVNANRHRWHTTAGNTRELKAKEPLRMWVLQEYITNPLLFSENGKHYKFHIRHFYLYQPGTKPSYYKNMGKIALAKKPYVAGNWDDPDIHDTHFHGNSNYSWPDSINLTPDQLDNINMELNRFYSLLDKVITAGCYAESRACYELFGVDLMITQNYELKVLEVNAGLGLGTNTAASKADLFNGMLELIVDDYFPPINKDLILSVQDKFTKIIRYKPISTKRKSKKEDTLELKNNKYKYWFASEFIPEWYLNKQFSTRGNWELVSKLEPGLDYFYLDGKYLLDKTHYDINATLKNTINEKKKEVCEKDKLVINMSKTPEYKQYIMDSVIIDMLDIKNNPSILASKYKTMFNNPEQIVYIFKPISGYAGADIQRFNTFDLFSKYIKYVLKKWKPDIRRTYYRYWQLQEYIKTPLLLKLPSSPRPYKFHIRMYYIFRPNKPSFYLKRGLMATAELPYITDKWADKRIHDTHFGGRYGEPFPAALNLSQQLLKNIYSQLDEIFTGIDKILRNVGAGCFEEAKYCFHLFGADIMITRDYKVKIIELNDSPGLFYIDKPFLPTEKQSIIENIMDLIVDDYFPPQYKPHNPYKDDVIYIEFGQDKQDKIK